MTIYFVEAQGTDRVKVGFTNREVLDRLYDIRRTCPVPLILRATFVGGRLEEKKIHKNLFSRGWHSHGEWFLATPVLTHLQLSGIELENQIVPVANLQLDPFSNFTPEDRRRISRLAHEAAMRYPIEVRREWAKKSHASATPKVRSQVKRDWHARRSIEEKKASAQKSWETRRARGKVHESIIKSWETRRLRQAGP